MIVDEITPELLREAAEAIDKYEAYEDSEFDRLREAGLFDICDECGDGDETHPIGELGLCVRHGSFSPAYARQVFKSCRRPWAHGAGSMGSGK